MIKLDELECGKNIPIDEEFKDHLNAAEICFDNIFTAYNYTIKQYNELIMAVSRKIPNESRHETALRYIREAEYLDSTVGSVKEIR